MDYVELPIGDHPDWELDEESGSDDSNLCGVAESSVILYTLRRSRHLWLTSNFPKFSSKRRSAKQPEVTPPPHVSRNVGQCDLEIGPHVFPRTTVFEISYTSTPSAPSSNASNQPEHPQAQVQAPSSVTPELIAQVNYAAATNPQLASLLQSAASGQASADQLRTLGLLIQSMGSAPSVYATSQVSPETDLVLEFREKKESRWIIPRGPVVCERSSSQQHSSHFCDIFVSTTMPLIRDSADGQQPIATDVVTFRFTRSPPTLWEFLCRWSGGEAALQKQKEAIDIVARQLPARSYLPHRLSDIPLVQKLQKMTTSRHMKRYIKPSTSSGGWGSTKHSKSRTSALRARNQSRSIASPDVQNTTAAGSHHARSDAGPVSVTKLKARKRKLGGSSGAVKSPACQDQTLVASVEPEATPSANTAVTAEERPGKKRSKPKAKVPPPPSFACHQCGNPDMPLLIGGRYCRPCINGGKVPNLSNPSLPTNDTKPSSHGPPASISSASSSQLPAPVP